MACRAATSPSFLPFLAFFGSSLTRTFSGSQATPTAIATLKRIAANKKAPPAAQVSAAIALLDRSWGRPHQALEVGINRASLDEMSDDELLAIAAGADDQTLTSAN